MSNEKSIYDLQKDADELLARSEFDECLKLVDSIISNKFNIPEDILPSVRVQFAEYYIEIADLNRIRNDLQVTNRLIAKAFGIFSNNANLVPEAETFINLNKARGNLVKSDAIYVSKRKGIDNQELTFEYSDCIFDIKDLLSEAIRNYWDALKTCEDIDERYNIKNNLARALSRAGRNLEAIILFEENIKSNSTRWQSNGSYADALLNFVQNSFIGKTISLYLVLAEKLLTALETVSYQSAKESIQLKIVHAALELRSQNIELSLEIIQQNRTEQEDDYSKLSEYRKFVLSNNLFLNEHAIYCKCRDAEKDFLQIGLYRGSRHLAKVDVLPIIDGILNRLVSEFAYSRLQYYQYVQNKFDDPHDVIYSSVSSNDLTGYKIEQLRTSYRSVYSCLDKIANGIIILLEIKKNGTRDSYFENFFDMYRTELEPVSNIHLTALYSISSELNKDYGSLKHFKPLRNEMEHGFLAITPDPHSQIMTITEREMQDFTFELLKLTRSAIFSFAFLARSLTIQPDTENS